MHDLKSKFISFSLLYILMLPLHAKQISIGIAHLEPYISSDAKSGLFIEIITEAYKRQPQHTITFVPSLKNQRLIQMLNDGKVDVAASIPKESKVKHLSMPAFKFKDVAITRAADNHQISRVHHLQGLRISAFENAHLYLGSEYKQVTEVNPTYDEALNGQTLVRKLMYGRTDVSVLDQFIFLNALQKEGGILSNPALYSHHELFPTVVSYVGFRDIKLKNDFDKALQAIIDDGTYQAIYDSYLKKLSHYPIKH